jgi:hypothetical protein
MSDEKKSAERPGAVTPEKTDVEVGKLSGGEVAGDYTVPAGKPQQK